VSVERIRAEGGLSRVLPGGHATKLTLLRLLIRGPATVDVLAQAAGIHRTAVRRHMMDLVGAGLIGTVPLRGSRGRPRVTYSLTTEGREFLFARYDVVLDCLTRASVERSGPLRTRVLFEEAARTWARDLGFPSSTDSVMHVLESAGFQPELRKERGQRVLVSHACPVPQLAQKNPVLLCEAFHGRLLSEALPGGRATLRQTMAQGASECVHVLTSSPFEDPRTPPKRS
jgi:predicted ArsR family transcriptional regulator